MGAWIGTSGWSYEHWHPELYPPGLPARDRLARYASDLETLRDILALAGIDVTALTDDDLGRAVSAALAPPPSPEETEERLRAWDPVDLLVPEWNYLQDDPYDDHHEDPVSGLTLSKRKRGTGLRPEITRVLAVERLSTVLRARFASGA